MATRMEEYTQINCSQFNPKEENICEFLERFQVQSSDLLEKAGNDELKKAAILIKALPINIITDIQRRIKPNKLSSTGYTEITEKLTQQYEVKKSIIGASIQFINRKQSINESIESYAKTLNNLAAECKYSACCRDRLLRDTFVAGIRNSKILSSLLQDCKKRTFNDVVEKHNCWSTSEWMQKILS